MSLSGPEKVVLAVKLETLVKVFDGMLQQNGREPLLQFLDSKKLGEFWTALATSDETKDWILPLKDLLGTRNLTVLQWLNQPLKIAKIIVRTSGIVKADEVPAKN
jgi:hypothetical protein